MISLALIGKNIAHSKSKVIYEQLLNKTIDYTIYDINESTVLPSLDFLFKKHEGVSITSPYKTNYLSQVILSKKISEIGAINTIRKNGDGSFEATNTDYFALRDILGDYQKKSPELQVVLLGDGVMSKVTALVCQEFFIKFKVYSRKQGDDLENQNFLSLKLPTIVINCCSRSFVFKGTLPERAIFYDYNYDFLPHQNFFRTRNVVYVDGFDLLKRQAEYALKFFFKDIYL